MPRLVLVLLLLALAGCSRGGDPTVRAPGGPPASAAAPSATAAAAVPEALDFTASTVGGEPFDGASYAGRDLMVWFWAPW